MSVSTVRSPVLQDDQKFALMKFRRSLADILKPEMDDHFLVRWLRARNWNPTAAEKMIRDSMKWRERWGVDEIHNWKGPPMLDQYCPRGLTGFDNDGAPVLFVPFAGMDMYGVLHCVSRADFVRFTIQNIEKYMKIAYEQNLKHGPQARQFVIVFDMEGFNLKQYAWRPAGEVVISLIKNYEANYPEILKCCYIINVPKMFAFAFNIVSKFLDEYTLSKILIFKMGSKKWLPKIFAHVDKSQIPQYYGGTLTDSDGDPKCSSVISWGGKVPVEMYKEQQDDTGVKQLTEAVIKKGNKIKLEFNCENSGCFLNWEFRTIDHDIRFGVKRICNKTSEETIEIPLRRVASHQLIEEGFITCIEDCKYVVVFDNTYSYFKNKKIHYMVNLTTPLSEIEAAAEALAE